MISTVLSLVVMANAENVPARAAAQLSYRLFVGDCPKSPPPPASDDLEASSGHCTGGDDCRKSPNALSQDVSKMSEDAYLASLAEIRSEGHACGMKQLAQLMNNPEQMKAFKKDLKVKIPLLLQARRRYEALIEIEAGGEEFRQAELMVKQIEASIPFMQFPQMRQAIGSMQRSTAAWSNYDAKKLAPTIDAKMDRVVKDMAKNVVKDFRALSAGVGSMGGALGAEMRESLAQDTELIEAFRLRHKDQEDVLKPVACRVDAKYGKGAQRRDEALMLATVLGAGMSVAARGGAAALTYLNAARFSSASVGMIRTAGVFMTLTGAIGGAQTASKTWNVCTETEGKFTAEPGRCEVDALKAIAPHSCLLNAAMTVAAASTVYPWLAKIGKSWKAGGAVLDDVPRVIDEAKLTRNLASTIKTDGAVPAIEKILPQVRGEENVQKLANAIEKADDIPAAAKSSMKDALIVGAERQEILANSDNILHPLVQRVPEARRQQIADLMAKLTKNGQISPEKVASTVRKACVRTK